MGETLGIVPGLWTGSGSVDCYPGCYPWVVTHATRAGIASVLLPIHSFSKQFINISYEPGLLWELGVQWGLGWVESRAGWHREGRE